MICYSKLYYNSFESHPCVSPRLTKMASDGPMYSEQMVPVYRWHVPACSVGRRLGRSPPVPPVSRFCRGSGASPAPDRWGGRPSMPFRRRCESKSSGKSWGAIQ